MEKKLVIKKKLLLIPFGLLWALRFPFLILLTVGFIFDGFLEELQERIDEVAHKDEIEEYDPDLK